MRVLVPGLRPALALLVIAHGLAHAVLPLRGWMDPDMFQRDFMPLILYGVAVLGFTTAGIGLLGVTPFAAIVRPALVVSSAYSLIAIWRMGAGDLWWGAGFDVVLFFTGLIGLYQRLPAPRAHGPWWRRAGVAVASGFVIYVAAAMVLWPVHRAWGSLPAEHALAFPGDPEHRNPALETQHAVTVNAPPEAVWPWLLQAGQERGWRVTDLRPGHAMVIEQRGALVLEPMPNGTTRFFIRSTVGDARIPAWTAAMNMLALELPHFLMERRMMLQIKARAEEARAL